ncbi:MAG: hypothetical protein PsegKO_04100 [Pseudohongiellaceae bacterium]
MRTSTILKPLLHSTVILLVSAPIIILLLGLEGSASIPASEPLTTRQMARVEQLIVDATPPSPGAPGRHQVSISAEDLNLVLRYAAQTLNLSRDWTSRVTLQEGQVNAAMSVPILRTGMPLFLNLQADFTARDNRLDLQSVRTGALQLPHFLLDFALTRLRSNLAAADLGFSDINAFLQTIDEVRVSDQQMTIAMNWDPALLNQVSQHAQQILISAPDRERITGYYREISLLAAAIPADMRAVSLNTFMVPLFRTAQEHTLAGADPISENRTLLQTLAIYVSDESISQLVGPEIGAGLPPAKFVEVRLHRRQDLARHLVSMAAITASAGAGIAELLSTTKEAYDARYRSGFSFSDLAANSAGVLLASYATRDVETARIMQQRLANLREESDYMPELGNNRDGLSEDDFAALYADRNSPEYQARLMEIEQLILARPLYQNLPAL